MGWEPGQALRGARPLESTKHTHQDDAVIGTPQEMRALAHDLEGSVWTLASVGVLFESGLIEHLREPRSLDDLAARSTTLSRDRLERCLAVAATAGVVAVEGARFRLAEGAMPFLEQPMRAALQGEIRTSLMQALSLLDSSSEGRPTAGWRHSNPALLQSQGDASGGLPPMFKATLVPSMGDLAARLDRRDARFLDVGVGVASLAISMCRCWPELYAVGLDPFEVPLAIARKNIDRAGLSDRIELRQLAVQDLRDEESFDLAWLPGVFIPAPTLSNAVARVRASLRPGGWVLFPVVGSVGDNERQRAVWALTNELWGGPVLCAAEAESLLRDVGFSSVRTSSGPGWSPAVVAGQR